MRTLRISIALLVGLHATSFAQNDECAGAQTVPLGSTAFDTQSATTSLPAWPCAFGGGPDLWFRFVAPSTADVRFDTCGSSFDTALQVFRGADCAALQPVDCNDDACGFGSSVTVAVAAGDVYTLRVGGFAGGSGIGELRVQELIAPSNDDCVNAAPLSIGTTAFDTSLATSGSKPWSCGAGGGADVWFRYDATTDEDLFFRTCQANFDTVLEVYSGDCGALASIACSDDACGTGSVVQLTGVTASDRFWIRVGGYSGARGAGILEVESIPPPAVPPIVSNNCYALEPTGSVGGAGTTVSSFYFDLTTSEMASFDGVLLHVNENSPIGLEVYARQGTFQGGLASSADWTLVAVDDGTAVGNGPFEYSYVRFVQPLVLPAGTRGIALVGVGLGHRYRSFGDPTQSSLDGVVTISAGATTELPFEGSPFEPRYWEGALCHGVPQPGANFCSFAPANSTGVAAWMSGAGSPELANNDLVLSVNALPPGVPTVFLVAPMNVFFGTTPAGSGGMLCLDGPIGRYSAPGQPQVADANGRASLPIDLLALPSPTGPIVAQPGETWSFQAWYRDLNAAGSALTYFSGGFAVTVE